MSSKNVPRPRPGARYGSLAIALVCALVLITLGLVSTRQGSAWAQPNQNPLRGSVDQTPIPTPTNGPTATSSPTAAPGVHRLLLRQGLVFTGTQVYTGTSDVYIAYIERYFPTEKHGGLAIKGNDSKSILIRFELAGLLPPNATIRQAELVFFVDAWDESRPLYAEIHRVSRPWVFADATWLEAATGVSWAVSGCNGVGVDRAGEADDQQTIAYRGVYRGFDVTTSVRYWYAHPAENYGWLVRGDNRSWAEYVFTSSRYLQDPARRPMLRIDYTIDVPTATPSPSPTLTPVVTQTPVPTPTATGTAVPNGRIMVTVFDDANRSTTRDAGEPGLAGVSIDVLNMQERIVAQGVTGPDGTCEFDPLPQVRYRIREHNPPGYLSSTDDEVIAYLGETLVVMFGDYQPGTQPTPTRTIAPTRTPTIIPPATSRIDVLVYDDVNRNGVHNAGEGGLPGVTVQLLDRWRRVLATRITGADGRCAFEGLRAGKYRLHEINPLGYLSTTEDDAIAYVGQALYVTFGDAMP